MHRKPTALLLSMAKWREKLAFFAPSHGPSNLPSRRALTTSVHHIRYHELCITMTSIHTKSLTPVMVVVVRSFNWLAIVRWDFYLFPRSLSVTGLARPPGHETPQLAEPPTETRALTSDLILAQVTNALATLSYAESLPIRLRRIQEPVLLKLLSLSSLALHLYKRSAAQLVAMTPSVILSLSFST